MASDEMGVVPSQRLGSQMVFQDEGFRFTCNPPQRQVGDPGPKTRELSGFIGDHRYFQPHEAAEFRRSFYGDDRQDHHRQQDCHQTWNVNGGAPNSTPSVDGSEDEEEEEDCDEDEDDDVNDGDGNIKAIDGADERSNKNNSSNNTSEHSNTDTIGNVGSSRGVLVVKDGNIMLPGNENNNNNSRGNPTEGHHEERINHHQNAVTIADPDGDLCNSHYLQGPEGSASGQKGLFESGCGFIGRKDCSEFLRRILSDPLTGELMDDAVILPCGHSFGGGGIQHVLRVKACYTCSRPVSEESISPNLSLRAAVQAFRREQGLYVHRPSKRRRERFEQDKGIYGDALSMEQSRGKGVQFPFAVMDRVIIQGNKRTPPRFVGRKAIVTAQCLNGWYVVKTLDNAESVKLQYRSLAKASDDPSLELAPNKMTPNWLLCITKDGAGYST